MADEGGVVAAMLVFQHSLTMKFHGDLDSLKDKLLPLDLDGEWEPQPHGVWKFKCRDRAGLLWSETKGTVWFDGPQGPKTALSNRIEAALSDVAESAYAPHDSTIFVVHGRDHEARDQLELVLRRLGLEPFVLQITGGGGDTLIEALERQIGKGAQSAFGIVLVTPDDMGYLKDEGAAEAKPRARQNVIMEMGMLLASLTRKRCAILQKDLLNCHRTCGASSRYHSTSM